MQSKRSATERVKIVRKRLADGSVREYRYVAKPPAPRVAPDSIGGLILAYKASPDWTALKPSTRKNKLYYLRDLEELAHVPVAAVRRRTMLAVRDAIAEERGAGAANVFMRVSAALFTWAVDREWIEHSPISRTRQLAGGHLLAWTQDEADLATAKLPAPLARVVILARYTGQRRGDLCTMTWSAYDGATLRVTQQKTGARLVIPAHPTLRHHLEAWKTERTSTHILTSHRGMPWGPNHLTHTMADELQKLGMREGLNVHGLRKLAAAELADAGCSAHEIAAITGHKTLAMVQLYTASANQERLAVAAIAKLPQGGRK